MTGLPRRHWTLPTPPGPSPAVAALSVAVSYVAFFLWPPISLLVLPGLFLARSIRLLVIGVLLSPWVVIPLVSYTGGVVTYFNGTAVLREQGRPGGDFWNLDPELRCHRSTSG
jgi:hypothetical protein